MNPWKPALLTMKSFGPEYDRDIPVESRSGSGRYLVNLHRYTCTCPDYVKRRSDRPKGDLRRTCKHLRDAVLSLDRDAFGDELTRVIFKSQHGPYDRIWFAPGPDGEIIALAIRDDKDWLNLFVRRGPGEPYDRYGWNPVEKRWAYETLPPAADEILDMLDRVPGGVQ